MLAIHRSTNQWLLDERIALFSATEESQFLVFVDVLIGVGLTSSTPWNEANRKIVDGKGLLSRKSRKNLPNRRKLR
jgi:hypothetical protein